MSETTKRPTMDAIKQQFRMERHQAFLSAALHKVTAEGLSSLTMQGLADQLDCGIGTLYGHFPSKGALIAELQREALDVLMMSLRLSQAHLTDLLEAREVTDPVFVALARVVAAARFWIGAPSVFPQEVDLSQRMFVDPTLRIDDGDAARVLPAAMQMLDLARQLLEDAAAVGALEEGPSIKRAIVIIAGSTGVLLTSELGHWDPGLFDGDELSALLVRDLFRGWGADRAQLDVVHDLLSDLAADARLVPMVRR